MANLSIPELDKRNNFAVFADKVRKGLPFIDQTGKEIVVGYKTRARNAAWANDIATHREKAFEELKNARGSVILPTINTVPTPLTNLYKSSEFGGAGAGARTAKEDAQLSELRDQLVNVMERSKQSFVPIKANGKVHKVVGADSTPGTPKSDFHLIDTDGKECVWISHKDGTTARSFSQWGGMSEKERPVYMHPEVQSFIEEVRDMYPKGVPPATTVARKIRDTKLKNLAVFGIDYGSKLGRQNVSVLLQGTVGIKNSGNSYQLTASAHVEYNGQTPTGTYEPILMAMHKCDRSQFGIKCGRFSIYTAGGRKINQWV